MTTIAIRRRTAQPAAHPVRRNEGAGGPARLRPPLVAAVRGDARLRGDAAGGVQLRLADGHELSAIGAPTRPPWVALAAVYTVLVTAFVFGVLSSAGRSRRPRVVGGPIVAYGAPGVVRRLAPMRLRGSELAPADAAHIALGIVTVLLMLSATGPGAAAFGKRFRACSAAALVVFVASCALTGPDASRIAENLPTPWKGVWERVNIGAFLLWAAVLALLRAPAEGPGRASPEAAA